MVCSFINYRFPHIIQFFDKSRSHVQGNTCMRAELVVVSNCLLHFRRWKIMKEIFGGCLTSFERSNTWKAYTENLVSVKMKDHEKTQKNLDFPSIFHVRFARFLSAISRLHQHRSRKFKPHFSTRLLLWTFETMAQLVFRQLFSVPNVSGINVYREKGWNNHLFGVIIRCDSVGPLLIESGSFFLHSIGKCLMVACVENGADPMTKPLARRV